MLAVLLSSAGGLKRLKGRKEGAIAARLTPGSPLASVAKYCRHSSGTESGSRDQAAYNCSTYGRLPTAGHDMFVAIERCFACQHIDPQASLKQPRSTEERRRILQFADTRSPSMQNAIASRRQADEWRQANF